MGGREYGSLQPQYPYGSAAAARIALGMKAAGVDGLFLPTDPSTSFALIVALHLLGVKLKASLLPTGYGGGRLASQPAVGAAPGVDFVTIGPPAGADTAPAQQHAGHLAQLGDT